jgi:hypothetical protein
MLKAFFQIILAIIILAGCKQETELLTGKIAGTVKTYDQFGSHLLDPSGIQVALFKDTALFGNTQTDSRGEYQFENIPYGKYRIDMKKDSFVQAWYSEPVYHVGGYSPSFVNSILYQIPTFELIIDSVGFINEYYSLILYVKVNGDTILPAGYLPVRVFASNSGNVSIDNYVSAGRGYLFDYGLNDYNRTVPFCRIDLPSLMDPNFEQLKISTIYMQIYPLALGQGNFIGEYFPEALGKPSNVTGFNWNELVGEAGIR